MPGMPISPNTTWPLGGLPAMAPQPPWTVSAFSDASSSALGFFFGALSSSSSAARFFFGAASSSLSADFFFLGAGESSSSLACFFLGGGESSSSLRMLLRTVVVIPVVAERELRQRWTQHVRRAPRRDRHAQRDRPRDEPLHPHAPIIAELR